MQLSLHSSKKNMPCVTGWLEHNVWTQRSGLIFKDHISSDDGPWKVRQGTTLSPNVMHHSPSDTILKTSASFFINGKTWWYPSTYLIHNFCDSFQESLKFIYMSKPHFIFQFVQSAMFAFYEHYMQTLHYSMFTGIWWHVALLEIYNRKCNKVQSKLKTKKHFPCTVNYLWMTLTAQSCCTINNEYDVANTHKTALH